MQQPMQPILQHLFQASSLDDISRQRLETFVQEYPSFGIGHYLLSRKLKAEASEGFAAETQKTSLYFTNPFWLQWQLDHVAPSGGESQGLAAIAPVTMADDPVVVAEEPVAEELVVEELVVEEPVYAAADVETLTGESLEISADDDLAEELSAGEPQETDEPSAAERLLRSIEEARGLRETLNKMHNDFGAETAVAGETLPVQIEDPIHDEEPPFVLDEQAEPVAVVEAEPLPEPVAVAEAEPPAPAGPEPALVFEPYHTIDYFASQGIKFTQDENPSDPLGRQLKSFTEWLKGMRRLPQKNREVIPDRVAEEAVQTIAAHSIEGKDILTETMAEVLAKQGMRERAKAVYEKLSLLNPGKRAYFAAKIEQLNIP
jgi:hypothetical protein